MPATGSATASYARPRSPCWIPSPRLLTSRPPTTSSNDERPRHQSGRRGAQMSNADWANKDFYQVLGVAKDAEQAAIKKAYRKLAREHHPDSKPGDRAAEERFKQIAEAYDVVGDPEKRKEYDQMRSMFAGGFPAGGAGAGGFGFPGGGAQTAGGFDISDLFGGLFGGGGGATTRGSGRRATRGADLETEATIDFTEAVEGTTVALRMSSDAACAT